VDEPYVTVAGAGAHVYRAIDGHGQIVDAYASTPRAAADAAAFFRRAIAATGVAPPAVATDRAAAYPPALAAVPPGAARETAEQVRRRIERAHPRLKGRGRGMRGFKALTGAGVPGRARAFPRTLRGHFCDPGCLVDAATASPTPSVLRAWEARTADRLGH
jgi:transposase-like protein